MTGASSISFQLAVIKPVGKKWSLLSTNLQKGCG
jgi:hypothetical protein